MSSATTNESDRSQTLTAVIFMSLFAAVLLIFVTAKDRIGSFFCSNEAFAGMCSDQYPADTIAIPNQLINSEIVSACVDTQGLKISIALDAPLAGVANIQVFTTGEDVFPSEQGMADSFRTSMAIPGSTAQLDFLIPVESMPVGERIFGNIVTSQEKVVSSHAAYFVEVSDCSLAGETIPNPTLITDYANVPTGYKATCLAGNRVMIGWEFDKPVLGQYRALVAGIPYHLASIGNQPVVLFFSGDAPPDGPISIQLVSGTDQTILFEETFTAPICTSQ